MENGTPQFRLFCCLTVLCLGDIHKSTRLEEIKTILLRGFAPSDCYKSGYTRILGLDTDSPAEWLKLNFLLMGKISRPRRVAAVLLCGTIEDLCFF